jgi:5'-3' exonuclease
VDVHLIDGTYELFRHYYALPSARETDGREVGAVRGVLASVLGMIEHGATDGYPGLAGWGAKSTAAVLARYGHLESIPEDWRTWQVNAVGAGAPDATGVTPIGGSP